MKAQDPEGETLTYLLDRSIDGMSIDSRTGKLTWTPSEVQVGSQAVTVRVLDAQGGEVRQSFDLTVEAGQRYRYGAVVSDADGDALTYALTLAPDGMAINPQTGQIVWEPTVEQQGRYSVVLQVKDGKGGVDVEAFNLDVTPTTYAPVVTSVPPEKPAVVGVPFRYNVEAQDTDGDMLRFRLVNPPAGMTINAETGAIDWTPEAAGTYDLDLVIEENGIESSQKPHLQ